MEFILVVVRAFGPHAVGDVVRDGAEIDAILASEHAGYAVRVRPQEG